MNDKSFAEMYQALSYMPEKLIQIKKSERKYTLPDMEWEELTDAATDGLIKAIQKYDSSRNDSPEAWAYLVMEQHFNKKLNSIIRSRMRDQKIAERYSLADHATQAMSKPEEKVHLTSRDYELLEFIISCNRQTDSKGNPFCPNSSDIIRKGRFETSIKSRTTISTSIRRLKDAGYRFAEKEDRGSNQGYFILNPELYNHISFEEKIALNAMARYLPALTEGPVTKGLELLINRILKNYELEPSDFLGDDILTFPDELSILLAPHPSVDSLVFRACYEAARNRETVTVVYKTIEGHTACCCGTPERMTFYNASWQLSIAVPEPMQPVIIPIHLILSLVPENNQME